MKYAPVICAECKEEAVRVSSSTVPDRDYEGQFITVTRYACKNYHEFEIKEVKITGVI
jgi:hypothetical protein